MLPHFPGPVDDWRTVVLVLAAAGLVYGSLLAFRQPDVRGVIAYSSMGQMSLIVLGIFAANDLGLDGSILHSVSHGLVSAAMFLLAAMLIQRTGTDRFAELGGLAKGRPALATIVMVVGMLTLAVPGSANFAGEFSILAGVFAQGWGYAAVGAAAIVLAAMYTLRLISGVLHRARGEAVREESLDLRLGELALVVPLVAILLALSVWPAAISERSFPGSPPGQPSSRRRRNDRRRVDHDPEGRLARALACALALLAAAAICLLGAVLVPSDGPSRFLGVRRRRRFRRRRGAGRGPLRPLPRAAVADRRIDDARPARRPDPDPRRRLRDRWPSSSPGAIGAATTSASTTRSSPPRAAAWPSSSRPRT